MTGNEISVNTLFIYSVEEIFERILLTIFCISHEVEPRDGELSRDNGSEGQFIMVMQEQFSISIIFLLLTFEVNCTHCLTHKVYNS